MRYPSCCEKSQRDPEQREDLGDGAAQDPANRECDQQDQDQPVQPCDTLEDIQES